MAAHGATVRFTALDSDTDKPLPCRIHVKDAAGKPVRPKGLPFWHDHFVCAGSVELDLAPGQYPYEIDREPEHSLTTGTVAVADNGPQAVTNRLRRLVNLAKEGWWSGDLHVHRPPEDMELLMEAEDLRGVRRVSFSEWKQTGSLGTVEFDQSGWCLVRAMADVPGTFRFASTGPFYVEVGSPSRRVSKASAQFFLDWVRERMGQIKFADPRQQDEVTQPHRRAEQFWLERVVQANDE
jgi:hypothetical protein